MNPHSNTPGKADHFDSNKIARVDRLVNAAMDAEAANDFDGANIAWAKIAAMDDASRRSAATLQAGLESLRTTTRTPDVSAKVLARLGMKQATKRHEAATTLDVNIETPRVNTPTASARVAPPETRVLKSSRRSRKWYSISPALASFVLGGLASLGLVIAHQYTTSAQKQITEIVVVPQPLLSQSASPGELLPPTTLTAQRVTSLRMGDTSRYDQALSPVRSEVASSVHQGYWWKGQSPQPLPMLAKEQWWMPGSGELAQEPKRLDAGQVLLNKHNVDLFQLLLGEEAGNDPKSEPKTIKTTPITGPAKPIPKQR